MEDCEDAEDSEDQNSEIWEFDEKIPDSEDQDRK